METPSDDGGTVSDGLREDGVSDGGTCTVSDGLREDKMRLRLMMGGQFRMV